VIGSVLSGSANPETRQCFCASLCIIDYITRNYFLRQTKKPTKMDSIKAFMDAVSNDEAHAKTYKDSTSLEHVASLANAMGYDISRADFREHFKNAQSLSDGDLDNISGGSSMMGDTVSQEWYSGD
jgi:predicted ribosomally synthesized peptide with nif11-like leader